MWLRRPATFSCNVEVIRDIRNVPIKSAGHSITYKQGGFLRKEGEEPAKLDHAWHSRVQIEREKYTQLKAYFLDVAAKRSPESLGRELFNLPFEPYAPVRQQLLNLLRLINKARRAAGLACGWCFAFVADFWLT
jgi:hypothetical protein